MLGGDAAAVVADELLLLPLVVGPGVGPEPPAAAVPGNVAACCATNAEFKRGLRVEVPEGE